jgi:hypothetical protein
MKKSAGDDVGDGGASSVEPIAPNPIRSNARGQTDHFVADRVAIANPPAGGRRHKCSLPIPK